MAGFRIGRGRDNRTPQQPQHPQGRQPQQPYGGQAPPPPYGGQPYPQGQGRQPWPQPGGGQQRYDEPEYFGGDPYQGAGQQPPYGPPQDPYGPPHGAPHGAPQPDPYAANNPGHTQAFSINDPYNDPYNDPNGYQGGYQGNNAPAPPAGPRLPWKDLLAGIVMRPGATFFQMRDHQVWATALIVTFLYGLLAVFGFDKARDEAINATLSSALPIVVSTGIAFVIGGLILGAVTHTLARQLGGDGVWQPTVGLSMLVTSLTDAPRLLFALFLGGDNGLVKILGWVTWLAAGALLTSLVSKSHDLPWPKALAASSIQLLALVSIIKLGTL
ncbi:YIP1 family protein [Streptomyces sp. NPDC050504]|uniref:YIP1 family protein n=1 Tax=Streptomyces sp. NPDC050504 TaxID=3365618 RepID=UPI0037941660